MQRLRQKVKVGVVGGSDLAKIREQLGEDGKGDPAGAIRAGAVRAGAVPLRRSRWGHPRSGPRAAAKGTWRLSPVHPPLPLLVIVFLGCCAALRLRGAAARHLEIAACLHCAGVSILN